MQVHHDKHHRAYVMAANQVSDDLVECRRTGDFAAIEALQHRLAFNVSGHVLHSLFWQNLSPTGGGLPSGDLAAAIERDFGAFEALKQQMNRAAAMTMGSGWVALMWEPVAKRLGTTLIHDHESNTTQGCIPLLVIDAWEHAYYLQYQTDKAKYFEALWNVWNWKGVADRLALAQLVDLGLPVTEISGSWTPPDAPAADPGPQVTSATGR